MFAIPRLSRGLKGFGDLGVLLLLECIDSDLGESCLPCQSRYMAWRQDTIYIASRSRSLALEVVVPVFANQDSLSKVIKCGVAGAF
jgi:hypothetical protein